MNLLQNLFDFDAAETPGELVFFKLFESFVAGSAVVLAWEWGVELLRIHDLVKPVGIGRYVDLHFMLGAGGLITAGLVTLLAVLGYIRRGRYAYLLALILLHLQYAARFSLGKAPHGANMVGMTLLGLALAMVLFHDDRIRRRFTLGFTYFFIGLGYGLSACSKLIGTGITWPDGRHLWLWIYEKGIDQFAKTGALGLNSLQEAALSSHFIATVFLLMGLLLEASAFLLWWKRFRTPVMLALLAMHTGIFFVMNISFTLSMYELVLLALPWPLWLDRFVKGTAWMRPIERMSTRFA